MWSCIQGKKRSEWVRQKLSEGMKGRSLGAAGLLGPQAAQQLLGFRLRVPGGCFTSWRMHGALACSNPIMHRPAGASYILEQAA